MSLIEKLIQSRFVRALVMLAGIGGVVRLLALVFPGSELIRWMAVVYLFLIVLCIAVFALDWLVGRLWDRITTSVTVEVKGVVESLPARVSAEVKDALEPLPVRMGTEVKDAVQSLPSMIAVEIKNAAESLTSRVTAEVKDALEPLASRDSSVQQHNVSLYEYSAKRYGIGYDNLMIECMIRLDGSADVLRRVRAEAYSQIEQLDTFMRIPESPPEGREWEIAIDPANVRCLSPGRSITIAETFPDVGRLSVLLKIELPLIAGQEIVFELLESLPKGLYAIDLSQEEIEKRKIPYDYFGWTINRPTRKLGLRVYFPDGLKPRDYGVEVRYASAAPGIPSRVFQLVEQDRMGRPSLDGPEGGRYSLKLDIDYPMVGLIYILRWEPLESETRRPSARRPTKSRRTVVPRKPAASEEYKVGVIRALVHDAFTPQKLKEFCQDSALFKEVLVDFGPKSSLGDMADALLDYCETQSLLPDLLSEIQAANPRQYKRYSARLPKGDVSSADEDAE